MSGSLGEPAVGHSASAPMKTANAVVGLSALIAVLALVAADTGLFCADGGSPVNRGNLPLEF